MGLHAGFGLGDTHSVGGGVREMRVHVGPVGSTSPSDTERSPAAVRRQACAGALIPRAITTAARAG
jgi:hypothetical protein